MGAPFYHGGPYRSTPWLWVTLALERGSKSSPGVPGPRESEGPRAGPWAHPRGPRLALWARDRLRVKTEARRKRNARRLRSKKEERPRPNRVSQTQGAIWASRLGLAGLGALRCCLLLLAQVAGPQDGSSPLSSPAGSKRENSRHSASQALIQSPIFD